eukprot:TRINITY_DN517_c0_g1_i1.p1 TRINITY_DN517_c0_g1~~TRINITY_DN517_c0_g1_i1.p1  ORF type:complete len:492 (-),score=149.21 TRINITY_DN517_c0_g1_i1:353-1828(-)
MANMEGEYLVHLNPSVIRNQYNQTNRLPTLTNEQTATLWKNLLNIKSNTTAIPLEHGLSFDDWQDDFENRGPWIPVDAEILRSELHGVYASISASDPNPLPMAHWNIPYSELTTADKILRTRDLYVTIGWHCSPIENANERWIGALNFLYKFQAFPHSLETTSKLAAALIQYHDPLLYQHLSRISFDFAYIWMTSGFVMLLTNESLMEIWQVLILEDLSPAILFSLFAAILLHHRRFILNLESVTQLETWLKELSIITKADTSAILQKSREISQKTPMSYLTSPIKVDMNLTCLPVSVSEVLKFAGNSPEDSAKFLSILVVDCRTNEHYNAGHLPTAALFDPNLLTDTREMAVDRWMSSQGEKVQGYHLALMGYGIPELDLQLEKCVDLFLKAGLSHVSLVVGGFQECHSMLTEDEMGLLLSDHDPLKCPVCQNVPSVMKNIKKSAVSSLTKSWGWFSGKKESVTAVISHLAGKAEPSPEGTLYTFNLNST